jgi:hypothetical protein
MLQSAAPGQEPGSRLRLPIGIVSAQEVAVNLERADSCAELLEASRPHLVGSHLCFLHSGVAADGSDR